VSILSDGEIHWYRSEGLLGIDPEPGPSQLQPASIDLRLGGRFREFHVGQHITTRDGPKMHGWTEPSSLVLKSGAFVLAHTVEAVKIPHDLVGVVDGRSSLGRLGIMVHITAGYIDPGFEGQITLEMHNVSPNHVELFVGSRVCQIRFHRMANKAKKPYAGKYQGDKGAVASRVSQDEE
jgi:dCTP deaminase